MDVRSRFSWPQLPHCPTASSDGRTGLRRTQRSVVAAMGGRLVLVISLTDTTYLTIVDNIASQQYLIQL